MPPPEQISPPPVEAEPDGPDSAVSCAACGTVAAGAPVTWMFENDPRRGWLWFCTRCARDNLRSVEAKLDQEWW